MVTTEERLSHIEAAIVQLIDLNTKFAQSQSNLQGRTLAMERRADAMEKRAEAMEQRAEAMEKRADAVEEWAAGMEKRLESMDRFNRQTRRLWVMIARKVDWLDEEDIDSWEAEED